MRNLSIRFIATVCGLILISTNASTQQEFFNIPNDLCFTSQPSVDKAVSYNVTLLKNECVNMFASNPSRDAKKLSLGRTSMDNNARSSIIAAAKLTSVSTSSLVKSYNFGLGCGEAGVDDANVNVVYSGNAANSSSFNGGNTPFRLIIPASDILTITGNDTPDNPNTSQDYLKVAASSGNTATVSISTNDNQGQVFVAIFLAQGSPNPVAILDPKSTTALSFTTDKDIFVVPLIRPKLKVINGVRNIVFEVGDPESNAIAEDDDE